MQLQNDLGVLRSAGLGLAAVSYDSAAVLQNFAQRQKITFPLLADHESQVIRQFGVANREYRKGTQLDVDQEKVYFDGVGRTPVYGLAYPSVFVLGPDGKVIWRFVSETSELRLTGAAILERAVGVPVDQSRVLLPPGRVQVSVTSSNTTVGLGNELFLGVELKLPPGLHVYDPKVQQEYKGLNWEVTPSDCWTAGEPVFPASQPLRVPFAPDPLPVFTGTVRLRRALLLRPILSANNPAVFDTFRHHCLDSAGQVTATGRLSYQACDDRQCFPPVSVPLTWKFRFLPPDRRRVPDEFWREFEP